MTCISFKSMGVLRILWSERKAQHYACKMSTNLWAMTSMTFTAKRIKQAGTCFALLLHAHGFTCTLKGKTNLRSTYSLADSEAKVVSSAPWRRLVSGKSLTSGMMWSACSGFEDAALTPLNSVYASIVYNSRCHISYLMVYMCLMRINHHLCMQSWKLSGCER